MKRYVITVDRDGLEKGTADNPIRVEDTQTGEITQCYSGGLDGRVLFRYAPEGQPGRRDGARVWFETDTLPAMMIHTSYPEEDTAS